MWITATPLLRRALLVDAAASGLSGALLLLDAAPVGNFLGLPAPLLQAAGAASVAFALFVGWLGRRETMPRALAALAVAGNVAWVLGSLEVLFTQSPNAWGEAYVVAQTLLVAVLAECEFIGLRRSSGMLRSSATLHASR